MVDWRHCETILLDMDGTLLDLAFDNYFWRELVPRCLARVRRLDPVQARADLFARYAGVQGSLEWYCLDFWSAELDLDLRALQSASCHRIRYLSGAREFLMTLSDWGKRTVLVTNAHSAVLEIKKEVAGLDRYVSEFVSSHDFGFAKEQAEFWPLLHERLGFDLDTTLFVDDNVRVLDAAAAFGLRAIVAVTVPDSGLPDSEIGAHVGVQRVADLLKAGASQTLELSVDR